MVSTYINPLSEKHFYTFTPITKNVVGSK